MRTSAKRALVGGVKLVLTAAATWLILHGVGVRLTDVGNVDLAALELSPLRLIVSLALLFIALCVSARVWAGLVHALGGGRVPTGQAIAMVFVSNLGRYIPGKVFQLAGLAWLGKRRGVPASIAASAAVLAQALNLGGAALVGGGLVAQSEAIPGRWGVAALLAIIFMVILLSWRGAIRGALTWVVRRGANPEQEGSPALPDRSLLPWLAIYCGNWLLLGAAFYWLARGLGVDLSLTMATTAFAAAYLLGYLALFAPAGIGVREGFLVAFLGPAVGPGPALSVAAAQRVWITAVELMGALLGWAALRRGNNAISGAAQ